jgi:glycosyltransferase involved in cell wall biosynthesis
MILLIVTDAWEPQTNGVVTTLKQVIAELARASIDVRVIEPSQFRTVPLPSYPEIRIAVNPWRIGQLIREMKPDAVHVATEGPLGLAARQYLRWTHVPFTSAVHTKFPEYIHQRIGLPPAVGYAFLRWFHRPARYTLVTTTSHRAELASWGLRHLQVWSRGVDVNLFRPQKRLARMRPRLLYVGRVAVEKNVEAFLSLGVEGDKIIVGDGPARKALQARFPEACWVGYQHGEALAAYYADADVLVFPSRTDTFGLVMLEAMACGTPVGAFPVTGPKDIVVDGMNGALDANLEHAVQRALDVDRGACRAFAERNGWRAVAQRLVDNLVQIDWQRPGIVAEPLRVSL